MTNVWRRDQDHGPEMEPPRREARRKKHVDFRRRCNKPEFHPIRNVNGIVSSPTSAIHAEPRKERQGRVS
jgi:hypothetical protein